MLVQLVTIVTNVDVPRVCTVCYITEIYIEIDEHNENKNNLFEAKTTYNSDVMFCASNVLFLFQLCSSISMFILVKIPYNDVRSSVEQLRFF